MRGALQLAPCSIYTSAMHNFSISSVIYFADFMSLLGNRLSSWVFSQTTKKSFSLHNCFCPFFVCVQRRRVLYGEEN